jgi:hypothetical protein
MNGSTQNPLDAILNPPPPTLMNGQAGNAEADVDKSANATQTPEKIPGLQNPRAAATGSNDQTGGVAADEKGSGPAVAADPGTETPLPNSTGGAINPQPDARQNPSAKFDSEGHRLQTPDETEALNRMKSIQQNVMQGAESFFDKARELEKNGDVDGARAADDSARAEKDKALRLTQSISQIEGMIRNTLVGGSDSAHLRVLDAAFHLWVGKLPSGKPLGGTYNIGGEGGTRTGGDFTGANKCNVAQYDTLVNSGIVNADSLTRKDTGHPVNAFTYNRKGFNVSGLSGVSDDQEWDGTRFVGDASPGDVISFGGNSGAWAHVATSLGNGWHIGASESDKDDAFGQDKGININADEYSHSQEGFDARRVRSPKP